MLSIEVNSNDAYQAHPEFGSGFILIVLFMPNHWRLNVIILVFTENAIILVCNEFKVQFLGGAKNSGVNQSAVVVR